MTQIAELQDRLRRLAKRREDEGIYTDANLVEAASYRIAELEAENERLRKALDALDRMNRGVDWCDQDEQARRWSAARRALEGGENG